MTDRSVVYRLRAELGSFQASMAQASASTRKVAGDMTALSKEGEKSRRGLESVGKTAGLMGLAAGAGLAVAVAKAADFDQSMSKVQAATHESAANMEDLREAALEAGAATAFSATDAAEGIEALAKAGVATNEILQGGLMGALDLAAAGELEVGDAAEAAAGAMAQFKLSGQDVPHIADLLAAGAGKAQGEVSDMVMALKQAGTVSSQTGLSLEETTGALAAMAEQSLLGSDAGTSFKTMLAALTPNSDKAAGAMEEYNIHAFDLQGNFVGLTELAGQLKDGLGDLTQEQRATALETIFGSDAVRAASIIYDNGAQGIQKWIDKVDDAGFAAETAATKQDNLRGDLEKLGGSLETALIGTGEGAQGPVRALVQGAEDLVNAFNKLPGPAKNATAAMLGITAVLGGGLWFTSKVISGVASMETALTNLGAPAGTATRAMKGLARAGLGLVALEAGILAVKALTGAMEESVPGTEALTGQLLDLQSGNIDKLSGEFDSLGDSVGRLTDENRFEHAGDSLISLLSLGQVEGKRKSEARTEIDALDAALSNIATSSSPEVAAAALNKLAEAQGLSADEVESLRMLLPQYDEAVAGAANQTKLAALETDGLAGAADGAAGSVSALTTMTAEEAKALKESREAATATAREFIGLGDNLDNSKVSLNEWIRDLEKQAEALRDFQKNAVEAGRKGLSEGLIAELEAAGPAGALRMKQLADATEAQIARANKAWRGSQKVINDWTDFAGGVEPVAIRVNTDTALIGIKAVEKRLREMKDKTLTVRITASGTAALTPGFGAQGGFATGGHTGWGDPREPAGFVHGREFVFSEPATRGNEAMLERLHRHLKGYAHGGLVSAAPVMPTGGGRLEVDYQRLAQTLATVRPLYGDVHLSGDDSFRRELRADRRRAGLGGV